MTEEEREEIKRKDRMFLWFMLPFSALFAFICLIGFGLMVEDVCSK